ncbi:MAG TPA: LPS export ABC transporter periplasmic protein LptC [Burkholderiales bacterium]|nr:LPS export ABC transporter periplasmic protein LptC [Burkholderiales bacterium]
MKVDARKLGILAVLLLLAGASWFLVRVAGEPEFLFTGKQRHDPDYIVEDFHSVVMTATGQPHYELRGKRLTHYGDDGSSTVEQPYVIQYERGRAPTHARAERGFVPNGTPYIELTGNVHVAQGRDPHSAGADIRVEKFMLTLNKSD